MHARHHSTLQEGLLTGAIGAVLLLVWSLATDTVNGRPLYTPNVLGQLVFAADTTPATRTIFPGAVAGYAVLHLAAFLLAGVALTGLIHLAVRQPAWRMGMVIGVVLALGMVEVLLLMAPPVVRDASLRWSVAVGVVVAVVAMLAYLWRRHPDLRRGVREKPLGSEIEPPPHPPGGPPV